MFNTIYIYGIIVSSVIFLIGVAVYSAYQFFNYEQKSYLSSNWRFTDLFVNLIMGSVLASLCSLIWPISSFVGLCFGITLAVMAFRNKNG